jgi:anti-sigma regulatory factor (Ser/Thr protein kinase)
MSETRCSTWFPPNTRSIAAARRFVEWALAGVAGECVDLTKLMVSELATNAVRHARSHFNVKLEGPGADHRIRVEVIDRGPGQPEPLVGGADDEHRRGLRLVDGLADEWGWELQPGGKAVWFVLTLE